VGKNGIRNKNFTIGPNMINTRVSKDLLLNFFLTFSRFEFALKIHEFAKGNQNRVQPDWDKFANSIRDSFDKTTRGDLTEAVDYFLINPPWKQVLINGNINWNTSVPDNELSEIEKVLLLIRRVRNNLFHGGKFNIGPHEAPERTTRLLNYSLIILEACLPLSPEVEDNYRQAII